MTTLPKDLIGLDTAIWEESSRLDALRRGLKAKLAGSLRNIVAIGEDFRQIKQLVGHGRFMDYVETHFDMSYRTANRYMHVAEVLGPYVDLVAPLSQRALYLLSSASLSEALRRELIARLQQGQALTYHDIQQRLLAQAGQVEDAHPHRLRHISQGFHRLYEQAAQDLPACAGKLTSAHKQQLAQLQAQLQEMEGWIAALLSDAPAERRS